MRKTNSLKNFITSVIPFIVLVLLGFVRVNAFISELGIEIYAINQLFFQLFAYISLVEAGAGTLIQQQYYKYLVEDNKNKIIAIYRKSKKLLRKISIIILIVGFLLSFLLKFMTNNNLSLFYMQIVFMIFLFRSILEYLMFSPRLLLQADQKIYKINISFNIFRILEYVFEIGLLYCGGKYLYILIVTIIIRFISYYLINKKIYKEYPWILNDTVDEMAKIKGIKYVFSHKIAGAVYTNTDILLISSFLTPLMVTIYSSYNYIIKFINDLIILLSNSILSSFGNVMHKENNKNKLIIFEELNALFLFCAMFFTIVIYFTIDSFISLWIGSDKMIGGTALIFMTVILFHGIIRKPLLLLKDANGLFKETQVNAIAEAILNLTLSIILVIFYGINGVLIATIISTLLTNFWFYPQYMYSNVFKISPIKYYIKYFMACLFTVLIIVVSNQLFSMSSVDNYILWLVYSTIYSTVIIIITFIINYFLFPDFRRLCQKIFSILKKVLHKSTIIFKKKLEVK